MKYEFHVGDYVETVDGRVGYITETNLAYIPYIEYKLNDGEKYCQTVGCRDADVWESKLRETFTRIGQYDFTKPEQPKEIEKLSNDIPATFRIDGKICKIKNQVEENKWAELFYPVDLIAKINELVDVVNELRKEHTK